LLDELDGAEFDRKYGKTLDELIRHINSKGLFEVCEIDNGDVIQPSAEKKISK